jgi:glutathione S-transferase
VAVTLYSVAISHPSQAARLMLEQKGIEHGIVYLPPGSQPFLLRLHGFRGTTVPALRVDGRRIQGSRRISRELERIRPEPPLFPSDPARRRAVEEAEEWGDRELQPVPRRLFRWALANRPDLRLWMAKDVMRVPAANLVALALGPLAKAFSHKSRGSDERVHADIVALPAMLDRVDALIAEGTIGGDDPNAADFQIGTSVWSLTSFAELRPLIEDRPAGRLAGRLLSPPKMKVPPIVPEGWL